MACASRQEMDHAPRKVKIMQQDKTIRGTGQEKGSDSIPQGGWL
jgi:hypothetical protein